MQPCFRFGFLRSELLPHLARVWLQILRCCSQLIYEFAPERSRRGFIPLHFRRRCLFEVFRYDMESIFHWERESSRRPDAFSWCSGLLKRERSLVALISGSRVSPLVGSPRGAWDNKKLIGRATENPLAAKDNCLARPFARKYKVEYCSSVSWFCCGPIAGVFVVFGWRWVFFSCLTLANQGWEALALLELLVFRPSWNGRSFVATAPAFAGVSGRIARTPSRSILRFRGARMWRSSACRNFTSSVAIALP